MSETSSITTAFKCTLVHVVDGVEYTFPKPGMTEIANFAAILHGRSIAAAKDLVKECEITGMDKYKILKSAQDHEPMIGDVWGYCQTPVGAADIATKSLLNSGKSKDEAEKILSLIPPGEIVNIAWVLTGYIVPEKEVIDEKKVEESQGYNR